MTHMTRNSIPARLSSASAVLLLLAGFSAGCDDTPERIRLPHAEVLDLCANVVCAPKDGCHGPGVCDPGTGACTEPALPDETACDDGDACTHGDRCQLGSCTPAGAVTCQPIDACHESGECRPESGCTTPEKADGTLCSDGDACSTGDQCVAGACEGAPVVCAATDACHLAGMCNSATGRCDAPVAPEGTTCTPDGVDSGDLCSAGACTEGSCTAIPKACPAPDSCHQEGTCEPSTGSCSFAIKLDGSACDDDDLCTTGEICSAGSCIGGAAVTCAAADECRGDGECLPGIGCSNYTVLDDGSACDDGNACTRLDVCRGGGCVGRDPVVCAALDSCHVAGVCDPEAGGCTDPVKEDGVSCDDSDMCTLETTCVSGACGSGTTVVCEALDACHQVGVCDPAAGCNTPTQPDMTACDDSNACTLSDVCVGGQCTGTTPVICSIDPNDADLRCRTDDPARCPGGLCCNADTGECTFPFLAEGTPCDLADGHPDKDYCVLSQVCAAGVCSGGSPVQCDPEGCLDGVSCDPASGDCVGTAKADGTLCDDANSCSTASACTAGVCFSTADVVCSASDSCHTAGVCDPYLSACTTPPRHTGSACDETFCFDDARSDFGFEWGMSGGNMLDAGGAALMDYNGDGLLDVVLAGQGPGVSLYTNMGNLSFVDSTSDARVIRFVDDSVMGVAAADYDNDGDQDFYVVREGPNALFENNADGTFSEVAATAGCAGGANDWSTSAAFVDFDHDGDLDLYVGNYIQNVDLADPTAPVVTGTANALYVNQGSGTFVESAAAYGLDGTGATLDVHFSDIDGDGWADLFVCNDLGPWAVGNRLMVNAGSGAAGPSTQFTDETTSMQAEMTDYCRGISSADVDRDGDMDYYFSNIGANRMLRNDGTRFVGSEDALGLSVSSDYCNSGPDVASWGSVWADFDLDGWSDLYVANGFVSLLPGLSVAPDSANTILRNIDGTAVFVDQAISSGIADSREARGVAVGDLDNDGDVDLLQVNGTGHPVVWRNTAAIQAWIKLDLTGRISTRDAIGARVSLMSASSAIGTYDVNPNQGYASSSDKRLTMGIGSLVEADVSVAWPMGAVQDIMDVPSGTLLQLEEPGCDLSSLTLAAISVALGSDFSLGMSVDNLESSSQSINYQYEIRVNGVSQIATSTLSATVASHAADTVTAMTLTVPPTLPISGPTSARLVASCDPAIGGLNQKSIVVELTP